jgi:hypothetical protein
VAKHRMPRRNRGGRGSKPFDRLTALSKVEGSFDRLTTQSEVEGPQE